MSTQYNKARDLGRTGRVFVSLYRFPRPRVRKMLLRLMWHLVGSHCQFYSEALREIFRRYHGIDVGLYSHGGCFVVGQFRRKTKFGRFCSIAETAMAEGANHPMEMKSTHAFFFNKDAGYVAKDNVESIGLVVGNDVWIGHNAIILPSCSVIGDGAVIGAGAVVNKNVPPYAVVVGNPCKVVRYRFSERTIGRLLEEQWWDSPIENLRQRIDEYTVALEAGESLCEAKQPSGQ